MSNDILSGGRIDESTDGPNPPSVDDRSRNILQEQKTQQDQDAIGGTQFPPRVEPLPPIPVAPEVAPPLPVVPSFDFNVSGSVLEEVREITRQAMVDAFKNVTINGQSPSIEGSAISFNVQPPQPSASEAFMFQNGEAVQAGSPTANILPPQLQPREDVQSMVVSPPRSPEPAPQTTADRPSRLDAEDFGSLEGLSADRPSRLDAEDFGSLEGLSEDRPSRLDAEDFGSLEGLSEDRPSRLDAEDFGSRAPDDEMGGTSSAAAYKEAEARSDERRESDPNFNRESSIRQRGETPTDFKERQEQLKQEKIERAEREEKMARVRDGDLTEMPSGMIPVRFTRADGQRKILALVATELVGTVEGATAGERTLTLPPEDSYFEGGGGGDSCVGLALYTKTVGTPPNTTTQVWIGAGTIAGDLPSGFDPAEGKIIASGGSGDVWAEININETTGEVVSFVVTGGGSTPNNTNTSFYYTLGYYEYDGDSASVTNYGCGSLNVAICRNWFAAEAPFYGATMTRCGCGGGY
jgi:hypothetical protein